MVIEDVGNWFCNQTTEGLNPFKKIMTSSRI
jgi:hypothetical protein